MKVLNNKQIRTLDKKSIENQNISSSNLMERAANVFFKWMMEINQGKYDKLKIFVGPGNNGGDGLVIARLAYPFFASVEVIILNIGKQKSKDFLYQLRLLPNDVMVNELNKNDSIECYLSHSLIVDAIFGSGLNRSIEGYWKKVIKYINENSSQILAIDIPSGLFADRLNDKKDRIIKACRTLSFEYPKLSFFYEENHRYTGLWEVKSIGLDKMVEKSFKSNYTWIDLTLIKHKLKSRERHSHKGIYGHAALMVGSDGMAGAAVLCGYACMRSGVGKTSIITPDICVSTLQSTLPEAMVDHTHGRSVLIEFPIDNKYQAYGIGCGIGTNLKTKKALKQFLASKNDAPTVLDADAINIIAEENWQQLIPGDSVLTPHPGEFRRLIGDFQNSEDRIYVQKRFSEEYGVYVICKGGYTTITTPQGKVYFNTNGNPGMATGGSGDVLTGVITSLLAQGYKPLDASILGVYIHGYAGDLAAKDNGMTGLIARDLVKYLPTAFKGLNE